MDLKYKFEILYWDEHVLSYVMSGHWGPDKTHTHTQNLN